jgi:hypothetical protein
MYLNRPWHRALCRPHRCLCVANEDKKPVPCYERSQWDAIHSGLDPVPKGLAANPLESRIP